MECTICCENFDHSTRKPVIGLCGHTLCMQCCNTIMRSEPHSCPQCKRPNSYKDKTTNFQVLSAVKDVPVSIKAILEKANMFRYCQYGVDLKESRLILHNAFRMEMSLVDNILKLDILIPLKNDSIAILGKWQIECKFVLEKDGTYVEAKQIVNEKWPTCVIDLPAGKNWSTFIMYMDAECEGLGLEQRVDYTIKTEFTDFSFIIKGYRLYVSKAIMAQKSKYFARLFAANKSIMELRIDDQILKVFLTFLDVIHGSGLPHGFKTEQTYDLLALATKYEAAIVRITVENYFLGQGSWATWEEKIELAERYGLARLLSYARAKKTL